MASRPDTLTFVPPLDAKGMPAVSIGFIAYHDGVPVVDYRFLPSSAKLDLDWEDPWYSHFANKSLKRWQQSGLMMYLNSCELVSTKPIENGNILHLFRRQWVEDQ